jgi:CRP-like cAMP-binding protein
MAVTAENKEFSQLAKLVPLNTLSDDALKSLLQRVDIDVIRKGDQLFRQGDADNLNIYLLSGRIGLFVNDAQIDVVEDSSATARFPVAHQIPRKFTATALTKVEVVRIDSRMLSEALAENESADYQVEDELGEDDDADWMTQLLQSRVMQNIPASNLQGVMMRMQEVTFDAGDYVLKEGDEGDYYYLLHRGHAVVLKHNEDSGEETELAKLSPGAAFGEDALLSNSPRSSSVKMLTDGILLRLSKADFIELIQHPLSETVSYDEALALVEEGAIWLDVRSPEAYE